MEDLNSSTDRLRKAVQYCTTVGPEYRDECFHNFNNTLDNYVTNCNDKAVLCKAVPVGRYRDTCVNQVY